MILIKQALATAEETREIHRRWRVPDPFRCARKSSHVCLHPPDSKRDSSSRLGAEMGFNGRESMNRTCFPGPRAESAVDVHEFWTSTEHLGPANTIHAKHSQQASLKSLLQVESEESVQTRLQWEQLLSSNRIMGTLGRIRAVQAAPSWRCKLHAAQVDLGLHNEERRTATPGSTGERYVSFSTAKRICVRKQERLCGIQSSSSIMIWALVSSNPSLMQE